MPASEPPPLLLPLLPPLLEPLLELLQAVSASAAAGPGERRAEDQSKLGNFHCCHAFREVFGAPARSSRGAVPEERRASYQSRYTPRATSLSRFFPPRRTKPSPASPWHGPDTHATVARPARAWQQRRRRLGSSPKDIEDIELFVARRLEQLAPSSTSMRHVPQLALRHENGTGAFCSSQRSTRAAPAGASTSTQRKQSSADSKTTTDHGRRAVFSAFPARSHAPPSARSERRAVAPVEVRPASATRGRGRSKPAPGAIARRGRRRAAPRSRTAESAMSSATRAPLRQTREQGREDAVELARPRGAAPGSASSCA